MSIVGGIASGGGNRFTWNLGAPVSGVLQDNNGYFLDTTLAQANVIFPNNPVLGDTIAVCDFMGNSATNFIVINRNGSNIEGVAEDYIININNFSAFFVFSGDPASGWVITEVAS